MARITDNRPDVYQEITDQMIAMIEAGTRPCTLCRYRHKAYATGHGDRLARPTLFSTKREDYALEELVAELGAAFVSGVIGIKLHDLEDHAAYLASWLTALRNDKRCIFTAATQAQAAADWLLSRMGKHTVAEMEEAA